MYLGHFSVISSSLSISMSSFFMNITEIASIARLITDMGRVMPKNSDVSSDVSAEEIAEGTATETVSEENFDNVPVEPSDETVPDLTDYENHTDTSYEEMSSETEINSESYVSESNNESEDVSDISAEKDSSQKVPLVLKILVSLMCLTVIGGMVYVLFFDKNNK